ncbi:MAG: rhodanese-like domain-containing protein [bacterium]|nr:rhodanese-like domain-containing protein [bacterium]
MQYAMTQWYVFYTLNKEQLLAVRDTLRDIGETQNMNGLILVAHEGCNGTVAGSPEAIQAIEKYLNGQFGDIFFQHWNSDIKPFKRFKVDIRNEIVALKKVASPLLTKEGLGEVSRSDHLSPQEFHTMIARGDVTVLDTRNWYETNIGTFKNAIIPNTKAFQEFPKFVEESNIPKDKPVAMFCTSGIRCEKASEEMRSQGYKNVYQLDGGITNYLREFPDGEWQGECFVYDHRAAVDSHLQPSKRYSLCRWCGNPGDVKSECKACTTPCIACEACLQENPPVCSKECKRIQQGLTKPRAKQTCS